MYERYCQIRDSKGLKDADIARIASIPKSTFSEWKNGRSIPKEPKMRKIANALGVSIAYLMGWESVSNNSSTMALEHIIQVNKENGGQSQMAQFLYDNTVKPAVDSNIVTDEEYNLILQYRNADEQVKDMIVQLLSYAVSKED